MFLHLFPAVTTNHSVICKDRVLQRFLSNHSCQSVHHHGNHVFQLLFSNLNLKKSCCNNRWWETIFSFVVAGWCARQHHVTEVVEPQLHAEAGSTALIMASRSRSLLMWILMLPLGGNSWPWQREGWAEHSPRIPVLKTRHELWGQNDLTTQYVTINLSPLWSEDETLVLLLV